MVGAGRHLASLRLCGMVIARADIRVTAYKNALSQNHSIKWL